VTETFTVLLIGSPLVDIRTPIHSMIYAHIDRGGLSVRPYTSGLNKKSFIGKSGCYVVRTELACINDVKPDVASFKQKHTFIRRKK
jgi:hypothetical protein